MSPEPKKIILGIESSCDETAAALVDSNNQVLSSVVSTQIPIHQKYGGVVPEMAARTHIKRIIPVIDTSLEEAFGRIDPWDMIDAIAVTVGPGLIGSLLIGVNTAKSIAIAKNKPLVPINHIRGHIFSNFLFRNIREINFPILTLVASGGHTELILSVSTTEHQIIGITRDDAAGEAFDKAARLLDLPYPGGPSISRSAEKGNRQAFRLPRALSAKNTLDFSFSGLKTAMKKLVADQILQTGNLSVRQKADLAASFQAAIVDSLISKTALAAQKHNCKTICLAGGVAANQALRSSFEAMARENGLNFYLPKPEYCTDNAAMIAAAALPIYLENKRQFWYDVDTQRQPAL